jgi:hypothetical protein
MMMARALHPSALPEEAAVSMRLAQAQMVEHRLEEAAVMRRLHDDAAGQVEPHGGMCSVTLVRARARAGEGSARHWWWELAARSSSDGGSGGSSDGSGSDSGCSGGSSGASSDSGHQQLRMERYVWQFADAIGRFAGVEFFQDGEEGRRNRCVLTFYGLKAQAQIAAYQLEVALHSATHYAMQLGKATEQVSSILMHP